MHVLFIKKENYQQTKTEKKCFLIIKKDTWITKQQQLINFWFIAVRITEKDPLFAPRRCE